MGTQSFLEVFSPLVDVETFAAHNNAKDYQAVVAKIQGSMSETPSAQYWYWDDNGNKVGLTSTTALNGELVDKAIQDSYLPGFIVRAYQQFTGTPDNPMYNLAEIYESSPLSRDNIEMVAANVARAQATAGFGGEKFVDKNSPEYKDVVNKNLSNLLSGPNNTYNDVVKERVESRQKLRLGTVRAERESYVSGDKYITIRDKDKEAGFWSKKDEEKTNKKISSLETEINQLEKTLGQEVTDFGPKAPVAPQGPTGGPTGGLGPKPDMSKELAQTIMSKVDKSKRGYGEHGYSKEEIAEARETIKYYIDVNKQAMKEEGVFGRKKIRAKKAWSNFGGPATKIKRYNEVLSLDKNPSQIKAYEKSMISSIERHNKTWGTDYSTNPNDWVEAG